MGFGDDIHQGVRASTEVGQWRERDCTRKQEGYVQTEEG